MSQAESRGLGRAGANALLLAAGAIWGMGFVAQSTAMDAVGPFTFIALRFLIAALALYPLARAETRRLSARLDARDGLMIAAIGLSFFAGQATQQIGLLTTSVSNSGFLTGLYVVVTPFLSVLLFRDRLHWVVAPAAALALLGIFLLSGGALSGFVVGDWWTILSAVFWALQLILIGRMAQRTGLAATIVCGEMAVASALGFLFALPVESIAAAAIWQAAPEILYSGLFAGALAFTLQAVGQRYTTSSQAAIFLSSEAVFAALFAAILLGERLSSLALVGCGLIFAAMLAVELIPMRSRSTTK